MIALSNISASYVSFVINLYTVTSFDYPILCALAVAYTSFYGFQSESYITTISAAVKFIP